VLRVSLTDYQRWVEPLSRGFEEAVRFLYGQSIFDAEDLPYPLQLVVIASLFAVLGQGIKVDGVRSRLERWFYSGAASGVYSRSREGMAAKDLIEFPLWLSGDDLPTTIKEAHLSVERLQGLVNARGATYRGMSALLRRDGALDFLTGEPITCVNYFDDKIENHHIFPKQWCQTAGIPRFRYSSIVNQTPLSLRTNRFLGGKSPSDYLRRLEEKGLGRERIDEILRSHRIEPELLRADDFDQFFEIRTKDLLSMVNRAIGRDTRNDSGTFLP
jgi:hypothetical protein